jgi:hypothetical protein
MDWKSTLKRKGQETAGKILPMEGTKPALGWKARLAAALAIIGTLATVLSQYLSG